MASRVTTRGRKAIVAAKEAAANKPPEGVVVPKRRRIPRKEIPTTQDQRVDRIIDMMLHHKWNPKQSPFELCQKWGCGITAITKAAVIAGGRIQTAQGTLERQVQDALAELDDIKERAAAAGQFSASVRAVELKLKTIGAFNKARVDKVPVDPKPRGLPPELAQLNPPASIEEVEHFAQTAGPMDCSFETCRVHAKAVAAPETVH